jgi:ferric-dicitrate binding protein FerR (iron transport regulator)
VEKTPNLHDLLEKQHRGVLSKHEKALLDAWFDDLGKDKTVDELTTEDRVSVRNKLVEFINDERQESYAVADRSADEILSQSEVVADKSRSPHDRHFQVSKKIAFVYRIAASFLLIAFLGYGLFYWYGTDQAARYGVVETASDNQIKKILLSDGSIVWLKPGSTLHYPTEFRMEGERTVTLKGEALFEVEKNPAQPFIVHSGELITTVLGTSFNIKGTTDQIEVVVLTGKVSLTSSTDKKGIVVLPEEKAVYNGLKKQIAKIETQVEQPIADAIIVGTEYDMNFNDARMSEIIRKIEGKFNVMLRMENPSVANCVITADFTDQSLTKTIDVISAALTLEYTVSDDVIILKGQGCP